MSSWIGRRGARAPWNSCATWPPSPCPPTPPPSSAPANPSTRSWGKPLSWIAWRRTDTAPSASRCSRLLSPPAFPGPPGWPALSCPQSRVQVSHHPPAAAHHADSKHGWTLRQEIKITSKFRGKYLSIMPLGEHPGSMWGFRDCPTLQAWFPAQFPLPQVPSTASSTPPATTTRGKR